MGLDITAYQHVEYVGPGCGQGCVELNISRPERAMPLHSGLYHVFGDTYNFHAGSYGSYNRWRTSLCLAAHGTYPLIIWDNKSKYAGKPFVELIDFSDCEGVIGPEVSTKLAEDFCAHAVMARGWSIDDRGWFLTKYDEWQKAFCLAAGAGAVIFH